MGGCMSKDAGGAKEGGNGGALPSTAGLPINNFDNPIGQPQAKPQENATKAKATPHSSARPQPGDCTDRSVIEGLEGAYKVSKILGSGAEGNTWQVQDVVSGEHLAIKLIKLPLPMKFVQAIFREIKLQSELGEGHKYKECRGVGLLVEEDWARFLFRQMAQAVDYCHRHHVAHRDLKLDNTLLTTHNPPLIKLCDFGFARGWGESSHFTTVIGTPDYMSPQLTAAKVQGKAVYDGVKADVWAMGVLLCVTLLGKFPFEGDSVSTRGVNDPMKKVWVQQNKVIWRENKNLTEQLQFLSPEVVGLLDGMFELDERKRLDLKGIMAHPWYNAPMRSELQLATEKLEKTQQDNESKVVAGAFRSKARDQAIGNLIKLAASHEFRQRARDQAIGNLIKLASSHELRQRARDQAIGNLIKLASSHEFWQRVH
eukprot:gene26073-11776_t